MTPQYYQSVQRIPVMHYFLWFLSYMVTLFISVCVKFFVLFRAVACCVVGTVSVNKVGEILAPFSDYCFSSSMMLW